MGLVVKLICCVSIENEEIVTNLSGCPVSLVTVAVASRFHQSEVKVASEPQLSVIPVKRRTRPPVGHTMGVGEGAGVRVGAGAGGATG